MTHSVIRGAAVLRSLLEDHCFDLRQLDAAGFRDWLERHLDHWKQDPVFAQRTAIRNLRRAHPNLLRLEREDRRAAAADAAAASHLRLQRLAKELADADEAISGLTAAVERTAPPKRADLERKLESFRTLRASRRLEQQELIEASPERQNLLRLRDELQQLRTAIGLDDAEAALAALQKERGQRSGRAGASFEQQTNQLIHSVILPELTRLNPSKPAPPTGRTSRTGSVHVLRGVTLGAARMEIDALVVRQPAGNDAPVEVLAMVETKRNLNDLAHGFRHRQENLAWLTGDAEGYRREAYRTRVFTSGDFDRPAVHLHAGREFLFTRDSFRIFHRDATSSLFFDSLYLITRPGPIWGLSRASLNRLSYRVSTDRRWDPDDAEAVDHLLRWCRRLTHDIETPEVLRMYASTEQRAGQILFAVEPPP